MKSLVRFIVLSGSISLVASCAHQEAKPTPAPVTSSSVQAAAEPATPAATSATSVESDPWKDKSVLFVPPKMTPTTKVNLGAIERFTLPSGMRVIVVARHDVPVVDLSMVVRGGALEDPLDRVGLADFTAHMLRKGTTKRSADQLAEAIDFVGGRLDTNVGNQASYVNCSVRSKDLPLCLDLMSDIVEHPTFPEKEMGVERQQLLAQLQSVKDSLPALASEAASNLYFGDNDIRGRSPSARSVGAIDRAQILAYYKKWYAPNNAVLAIAGDFDSKTVRKSLERAFAGWKKHPVPAIAALTLPPTAPGALKVRIVDKPDATQSNLELVGPGIAHSDPSYPAVRLMDFTLGGGAFSSRLMKVVRSEGGKTYGAESHYEVGRDPGTFHITTFTRTAETGATLKLVLGEAQRMQQSGPTQEELDAAKGNMIGGFGLSLETGSDLARTLLLADTDGLAPDFVETYLDKLDKVTLADAKRAAADHIALTSLVVVGKAADIKADLAKAGLATDDVVDYAAPSSAADRQALADEKKSAGNVDPKAAAAGQALLDQAAKAAGGVAALRKLHTLRVTASGTLNMQGQSMPIAVTISDVPQKARRVEMNIGPMKIVQVASDKGAFIQQGEQVKDLPPAMAAGIQRELLREPAVLLANGSTTGNKLRALPPVTEGNLHFDVVEVISPAGDATQLWLDPKTHLVSRMTFTEEGKQTREDFSDYRAQGGVQFAWKSTRTGGDGEKIEMTYQKIELNPELAPSLFTH